MGWNRKGMIMAAKKKQPRKRAGKHALRARAAGFAEGAGAMGDLGKPLEAGGTVWFCGSDLRRRMARAQTYPLHFARAGTKEFMCGRGMFEGWGPGDQVASHPDDVGCPECLKAMEGKPAKQAEHPTDQSIIVGDVFEDVASGIRVRVAGITADTANMAHLNAEGGYTVKCDVLRDPARYRRLTVYKGLVQHFPSNDVNVVTGCRDCPFYASNYYCEHPKSGGDVTPVESGAPPPTCPLRDGPTLVRLKGTP